MASLGGFDMNFCNIPAAFSSIAMDGDEYVRCTRCGFGGCDVRVSGCGCTLHVRCLELGVDGPLMHCPLCAKPTSGLVLFPMSFREIDEARRTATALSATRNNRGKKRKGGAGSESAGEDGGYVSERRTGRWTTEEMHFCDKLISTFEAGSIPLTDGTKLNEFLGNMLKSKQSRLTKKMKNAKLSTKLFKIGKGHLDLDDAREFSELEESFFQSITNMQERSEIKFHMQKEWREQFSQICTNKGQPLDADSWLSSVEEMDRRDSQAKDAARMAKRRFMMGVALKTDSRNPDQGVFIEKTESDNRATDGGEDTFADDMLNILGGESKYAGLDVNGKSSLLHSAPFLSKATTYLQRHNVPFEHIDVWVPSYVANEGSLDSTCRLCYAGSATTEKVFEADGKTSRSLNADEKFNLYAFGDYSQKFSFDVGCGLPGRVYESGRPTWEESVHNAPHNHFERCGGALQWGIRTVIGIPVASPNVGRIVVVLYSCFDRHKDEDLVSRLSEEFTRLMPSPKWKLVVDIGSEEESPPTASSVASSSANTQAMQHQSHHQTQLNQQPFASQMDFKTDADFNLMTESVSIAAAPSCVTDGSRDPRIDAVISLLGEYMPSDPDAPSANYLSGFMSLRLLLLRQSRSMEVEDYVRTILDSYSSYTAGGRERSDIAMMLARDYMYLSQPHTQPGQNFMASASNLGTSSGLSLFGLPSTSSSPQNSPALTPIPGPGIVDSLSIVSN